MINQIFQKGATFNSYVIQNTIVIEDLDQGGASVTNDIESVIHQITNQYGSLDNRSVIYRDSDSIYDGIKTLNNEFAGFIPLGVKSLKNAIDLDRRQT